MRNLFVAFAVAVAGASLSASQTPAKLPPPCNASSVVISTIADKSNAVPAEFQADLAAGTLRLEVGAWLTGKPVPGGEAKDLAIDWKARGGQWDAASAATVLQLLSKVPNSILVWSGSAQPTCHQDVINPIPAKTSKCRTPFNGRSWA